MTKKTTKRSSETKMRSMKQGQQKIKLDIKKPSPSSPPLPLPFPPKQNVNDIVAKLILKPRLARFPNAFIMYRNEYVQYLKSQGFHISMTELSPMISASWKKESEFVKEAYTKLSSEAEKMYVRDTGSQKPYIQSAPPKTNIDRTTTTATLQVDYNDDNISNINIFDYQFFQNMGGKNNSEIQYSHHYPPKIDNNTITQSNSFVTDPNSIYWPTQLTPSFSDLIELSSLDAHQVLGSPASTISSPSDTSSYDELNNEINNMLFSPELPELDDNRFFDKTNFTTPSYHQTAEYLYGQSFPTPAPTPTTATFSDKI